MPRDITHWLVVEAVAAGLGGGSYEAPLERAPHLAKIGAVFHDALFYVPRAFQERFRSLADEFHGVAGEDTFRLIKGVARRIAGLSGTEERRGELIAFLVGLIAHVTTDVVFHPFITYHTGLAEGGGGRARSAATQAHRRLEALIDVCLLGGFERLKDYSLAAYLARAGNGVRDIYRTVGEIFLPPDETDDFVRAMAASFERFAKAQRLFKNRLLSGALFRLRPLFPAGLREIVALGYAPQLTKLLPRVAGRLDYRHPVTGEELVTDLDALFQRAVAETMALCLELEPVLAEGRPWPEGLAGPTLDAGLEGAPRDRRTHFAPRRLVPV